MYYLNAKVTWQNDEYLIVELNNAGYRGKKMFQENLQLQLDYRFYVIEYKSDFLSQLLFFLDKKTRNLSEIILSIKNVGILTVYKIFKSFNIEEFLEICKNQNVNELITKAKISENNSKKIIQEIRSRIFNQKYSLKQMNVIKSLNKLGYKISDIYKVIENIDINLKEEMILEQALLGLNNYAA